MSVVRTRRVLDPAGADAVLQAAEEVARGKDYRVVIAAVDAAGDLLALRRLDDTQPASVNVAIDKARTAAIFVRPSREIEDQVTSGRLGALALHGAAALTGGIPLRVGGPPSGRQPSRPRPRPTAHRPPPTSRRRTSGPGSRPAVCWSTPPASRSTPGDGGSRARSSTTSGSPT